MCRSCQGGPDFASRIFLYAMLLLALTTFATAVWVDRSWLGFGLRCIRQNENAANMLGIDVDRLKNIAFVLSAIFVGAGGAIYASWVSYIDPTNSFAILTTIKIPVMVLLGGAGTLFGPIIGVMTFQLLEERIWSSFLEIHSGVLGLVIVVLVFCLPGGLIRMPFASILARLRRTARRKGHGVTASPILEAEGVSCAFGGVRAVDAVTLKLWPGEIVGLIGPNGAGKTTLVNLMTGVLRPTAGRVRFEGRDVTGQQPHQASRRGIARTFQIVQPFPEMTVIENVAAAALFAGNARSIAVAKEAARAHLAFVGLGDGY